MSTYANDAAGRSAIATFAGGPDAAPSFKRQVNDAGAAIAARYRKAGYSEQDASEQAAAFERRFDGPVVWVGDHDPEPACFAPDPDLDATLARVADALAEGDT